MDKSHELFCDLSYKLPYLTFANLVPGMYYTVVNFFAFRFQVYFILCHVKHNS